MDRAPKVEKTESILDQQTVQDFIRDRNIRPEDFPLIEKLATFPKRMIITDLHNLFNMAHERSGQELEMLIQNASDSAQKELYEIMNQFYQVYDWAVSWHLVRILEEI